MAKLLGRERLERLQHGCSAAALTARRNRALLGPAAAIAVADGSGGSGLGGSTTGSSTTATSSTSTSASGIVTVTNPCSGSLGTSTTTTGPSTTTTIPTTTVLTSTTTTTTPTTTDTTGTGTSTTTTPTTTTTTTTTTVPTTITQTTPGTTTVTTTPACPTAPAPTMIAVPKSNPFRGRAMWIWEMSYTDGGNVAAIIAQAKRYGIGAVYVKSSDGSSYWPQFSRELVLELHEAGLKVCAWQYVYGIHPVVEANLAYRAARDGADCLVIDAESQYQSRYTAAQTYISRLRKLVGKRYPVGLAGFPYVDYHLTFPYSVFLGTNGAQYNLPQMYWADIGTTVPFVYAHTYEYNEIYRRPIYPLGQLWGKLPASSIESFNLLAKEYGATGVSWWDWQSAPLTYFSDIDKLPALPVSFEANRTPASIFRGNKGDLVIWAQEHLYGAGYRIGIDGQFGPQTQNAVKAFQRKHKLPATGTVNAPTWNALVKVTPVNVTWTRKKNQVVAVVARRTRLTGGAAQTTLVESMPAWMKRTHSHNELHADVGAGGTPRNAKR